MAADLPSLSAARLVRRQLHVILALDCSGSMTGDKIASLNYAMRAAIPEMRAAAEDNPETDVFIRVLRFSSQAEWHVATPTPVSQFEWQDVAAGGETNMGDALCMMAEVLNPERMPGRQLPPVLVLISDGQPSDDFEGGLKRLLESPFGSARCASRSPSAVMPTTRSSSASSAIPISSRCAPTTRRIW
ncbi:MAG: VWA domain-containing protein [Alphaproteobacteria bacterium]|nr:VWA domain-containing protein [Alphaproteobacteria bacterium]